MRGINVYTTPQDFVKVGFPRASRNFDQIVGIQTDDGERLWSNYVSPGDSTPPPKPIDTEESILPLNEYQAAKLLQFFKDWFLHLRTGAPKINCHWFARWMTDAHTDTVDHTPNMDIIQNGVPTQTLAIGQAGILGFRMNNQSAVVHSLIGLGSENPKCLQVMAMNGYLATADYDTVHTYNSGVAGFDTKSAEKVGYNLYASSLREDGPKNMDPDGDVRV